MTRASSAAWLGLNAGGGIGAPGQADRPPGHYGGEDGQGDQRNRQAPWSDAPDVERPAKQVDHRAPAAAAACQDRRCAHRADEHQRRAGQSRQQWPDPEGAKQPEGRRQGKAQHDERNRRTVLRRHIVPPLNA